ncbi:hypothetical protein [Haloplanus pelagicus]|jgi:hypothetical protein|uniref:hypothetical protein n=1 Tax=Haloplanus pelagicus TaxID=2949995 RepID=UPI00203A9CCF|nr:hypothetical protein [Haloplanus sp. HW8-1]
MHDFWTIEGQDRRNEGIHFLKNAGLLGVAFVFLALSGTVWPLRWAGGSEPRSPVTGAAAGRRQ